MNLSDNFALAFNICFCSQCVQKVPELSRPCSSSASLPSLCTFSPLEMSLSKFGAPKVGEKTDMGRIKKLAQRVEVTLTEETLYPEPKQIDPRSILVAPLNRDGAPPNVQHIHRGIPQSIQQKGFDRSRPQVGILVEFKSQDGKKKLLEHNRRFSKGVRLLPPIEECKVLYGSLAGSHFNLALRCILAGTSSPVGDLSGMLIDDPALSDVVQSGHRWWILSEEVSTEDQVDISLWRNQDQNENQSTHEIEILQTIKSTAEDMSKSKGKVTLGDLVARAMRRNPAKISASVLMALSKFYIGFLENSSQDLVDELVDFHSTNVDPKEIIVAMILSDPRV